MQLIADVATGRTDRSKGNPVPSGCGGGAAGGCLEPKRDVFSGTRIRSMNRIFTDKLIFWVFEEMADTIYACLFNQNAFNSYRENQMDKNETSLSWVLGKIFSPMTRVKPDPDSGDGFFFEKEIIVSYVPQNCSNVLMITHEVITILRKA